VNVVAFPRTAARSASSSDGADAQTRSVVRENPERDAKTAHAEYVRLLELTVAYFEQRLAQLDRAIRTIEAHRAAMARLGRQIEATLAATGRADSRRA